MFKKPTQQTQQKKAVAGANGGGGGNGAAAGVADAPAPAPETTPDFGNAGTIISRTFVDGVALRVSQGEYLQYTLTVNGPIAVFTYTSLAAGTRWQESTSPQATYAWQHFRNPSEINAPDDRYSVNLSFVGAPITYTLTAVQCDKTGKTIKTLQDLDLSSTDATDYTSVSLEVLKF